MKSFALQAGGSRLLYHDIPGDGRPLIMLHGLGCASSCDYPRLASDPALAGRRMILLDLLGSGFSDRPAGFGYSVEDHARTVAELATDLAPDSVDLYGHSMGGSVAIVAATLLGDRVRHLVMGEPNLDPGGGTFSRKVAANPEADYVAHGHRDLVKAARTEGNSIWAASMSISAPYAVHRSATSLVVGGAPTWRELLYAMKMPRTIIFGEASLPDPDTERLPQQGVGIGVVPQAGHGMIVENPGGVASALLAALR
jgi:pimeloyl-ACP methyl ester carboxylesterase